MPSSISLITLGIADVPRATRFYKALGFVTSKRASQEDVTFMRAGSVVLALWGRQAQLEDARQKTFEPAMAASWLRGIWRARLKWMRRWHKPKLPVRVS
jgi:hypothetical protein